MTKLMAEGSRNDVKPELVRVNEELEMKPIQWQKFEQSRINV